MFEDLTLTLFARNVVFTKFILFRWLMVLIKKKCNLILNLYKQDRRVPRIQIRIRIWVEIKQTFCFWLFIHQMLLDVTKHCNRRLVMMLNFFYMFKVPGKKLGGVADDDLIPANVTHDATAAHSASQYISREYIEKYSNMTHSELRPWTITVTNVTVIPDTGKWPSIRLASLESLRSPPSPPSGPPSPCAPSLPPAVPPPGLPAGPPACVSAGAPAGPPPSPSQLMRTRPDLTIVAARKDSWRHWTTSPRGLVFAVTSQRRWRHSQQATARSVVCMYVCVSFSPTRPALGPALVRCQDQRFFGDMSPAPPARPSPLVSVYIRLFYICL